MIDYFHCGRGVCQGVPLSPLLFCLVEEVLSRGISELVSSHKILPMIGPKDKDYPTRVLYVDDIFVFYRATRKSLTNLMEFLHIYDSISNQWMNSFKSHFSLSMSLFILIIISSILGCHRSTIPLNYLGVPIFFVLVRGDFFNLLAN